VDELTPEIVAFNSRNPEFKINARSIATAMQTRRRNRANTVDGVTLPDSKDALRDRARFAVTAE
jgi:hypothetical protein